MTQYIIIVERDSNNILWYLVNEDGRYWANRDVAERYNSREEAEIARGKLKRFKNTSRVEEL